jgi:hypothetical protein
MAPNLLWYQLLLVALVLICLLIHVGWPDHPSATSKTSLQPDKPRRKRSTAPTPFTGLIHKPFCDACEQGVVYLPNADKYRELTRQLSQEQKGLDERTFVASRRPCHPW